MFNLQHVKLVNCISSIMNVEELCKTLLFIYNINNDEITGYAKGKVIYDRFMMYLNGLGYSFAVRSSKTVPLEELVTNLPLKNDNTQDNDHSKTVRFDTISGLSYMNGGLMVMQCLHGSKYYNNTSTGKKQVNSNGKKTRIYKNTKKLGCSSKLIVKVRYMFTDEMYHDIAHKKKWAKLKAAEKLRLRITLGVDVPKTEVWYFIKISLNHNHPIAEQLMKIHPELSRRIEELVAQGITSTTDIKLYLRSKVNEMFKNQALPSLTNSAFYPADSVIYSHVYKALFVTKGSIKEHPNGESELSGVLIANSDNDDNSSQVSRDLSKEIIVSSEFDSQEDFTEITTEPFEDIEIAQSPEGDKVENYQQALRQILNEAIDLTFSVTDIDVLRKATESASIIMNSLRYKLPRPDKHLTVLQCDGNKRKTKNINQPNKRKPALQQSQGASVNLWKATIEYDEEFS